MNGRDLIAKQNAEAKAALAEMNRLIDDALPIIRQAAADLRANAKPNPEILSDLVREHLGIDFIPDWLDDLARKALDLNLPWDDIETWAVRALKLVALVKALR